jgi:hypothetical protein
MTFTARKRILAASVTAVSICGSLVACDAPHTFVFPQTQLQVRDSSPSTTGSEIFAGDVADGGQGTWRLVAIHAYEESDLKSGPKTAASFEVRLSPHADLSEPDAEAEVKQQDFSQDAQGTLSLGERLPLDISRQTGAITRDLGATFNLDPSQLSQETATATSYETSEASFTALVSQDLQKWNSFHIYSTAADKFEMRMSMTSANGETGSRQGTITIDVRAVYELVVPSAQ